MSSLQLSIAALLLGTFTAVPAFADNDSDEVRCATELNNIKRAKCFDAISGKLDFASSTTSAASTSTESIESKQIKACAEDAKLVLDDPNSLEVISARSFKNNADIFSIELKITAKNVYGGRVRDTVICGFKTEQDVDLNPDDFWNKRRKLFRK